MNHLSIILIFFLFDIHLQKVISNRSAPENRQKKNVLLDAYPNAFNKNASGSPYQNDITTKIVDGKSVNGMNDMIWERKYEIDSVAAVLKLATEYYFTTNDSSFIDDDWLLALSKLKIMKNY